MPMYCSFCGKSQDEVKKLIAGPGVFICDECSDVCNSMIRHEEPSSIRPADLVIGEIYYKVQDPHPNKLHPVITTYEYKGTTGDGKLHFEALCSPQGGSLLIHDSDLNSLVDHLGLWDRALFPKLTRSPIRVKPLNSPMSLATRLLRASSSEVGKILREELGDTDLFATRLLKKADWDGPDIFVHGGRGAYTVEVFPILNPDIEHASFDERRSRTVRMSPIKMHRLAKALRMRQDILRRVAEGFLSLQIAVPERYGDRFKPVSVRQVAECAHLHETTVKSAVASKVIAIGGQRIQFDSLVT